MDDIVTDGQGGARPTVKQTYNLFFSNQQQLFFYKGCEVPPLNTV